MFDFHRFPQMIKPFETWGSQKHSKILNSRRKGIACRYEKTNFPADKRIYLDPQFGASFIATQILRLISLLVDPRELWVFLVHPAEQSRKGRRRYLYLSINEEKMAAHNKKKWRCIPAISSKFQRIFGDMRQVRVQIHSRHTFNRNCAESETTAPI